MTSSCPTHAIKPRLVSPRCLFVLSTSVTRSLATSNSVSQISSLQRRGPFRLVVIRLGSSVPFSQELIELQEEVKPLWKLPSCPRDFKRTSVERLFREAGFRLDWCSFRLIESDEQNLQRESARRGPSMNIVGLPSSGISEHAEWRWARSTKADVPKRSYFKEIATTVFVPTILLLVLAALLSTALCLHRDKIYAYCRFACHSIIARRQNLRR